MNKNDYNNQTSLFDLIYDATSNDTDAIFNIILRLDYVITKYADYDEDLKQELILHLFSKIKNFKIKW